MINRFRHAVRGLRDALQTDRAVQVHLILSLLVVLAALVICVPVTSWALLLLAIGGVVAAELANTALEHLADRVHPEQNDAIRRAKDIAAGAVLFSACIAALIGVLVFFPPLFFGLAGACRS